MTQTNISFERRKEIKEAVYKTLAHYGHYFIPVKIKAIARSFANIRLISYSKHIKKLNISYDTMLKFAGTKDACTDYYANSNLFIIYYNDIDRNITTSNRYRWNIAHELGHIMLEHHITHEKTRIFRNELSSSEYNGLEEEADYFASLVLVPHAALIGFQIKNANYIKVMCKISEPAAKRRYYEFVAWKSHVNAQDEYDNRIFHLYYNFIYKRKCKNCGAGLIQRYGKHCPICGNKNTLEWGDGSMDYKEYETTIEGFLETCLRCGNKKIIGNFCQICGAPARNYCTNYFWNEDSYQPCTHSEPLPGNARYCPDCGAKSLFFHNDILDAWDIEYSRFMEEEALKANIPTASDGFMNIPEPNEGSASFPFFDELPFK